MIVSLSLLMSKTFKLKKVMNSFVPEPISYFWIPIYVYESFMNIMSISHIPIIGMLQLIPSPFWPEVVAPNKVL